MKTKTDVPPTFGAWFRHYRRSENNRTQNDIIRMTRIGRRTLIDIESGVTHSHTEDIIKYLATGIDLTIVELTNKIDELWEDYNLSDQGSFSYTSLLKTFTEIDDHYIHLIRSVYGETRRENPEIVNKSYFDLLYSQVSQRFSSFDDPLIEFSKLLLDKVAIKRIHDAIPDEDLAIQVEEGFKKRGCPDFCVNGYFL